MSDMDEGDVPYKLRACAVCAHSETTPLPVQCPSCGASWPAKLESRWPYDGKPAPWMELSPPAAHTQITWANTRDPRVPVTQLRPGTFFESPSALGRLCIAVGRNRAGFADAFYDVLTGEGAGQEAGTRVRVVHVNIAVDEPRG